MWLATGNALLRFDGVRGVPWRATSGTALPDDRVRTLFGSSDGALWIGTLRGLARLKDRTLTVYPSLQGKAVNAIEETADGTIWVGGTSWLGDSGRENAFLCAVRKSGTECQGEDGRLGDSIVALHRDPSDALWVAGTDRVWKWTPQSPVSYKLPSAITAVRTMTGTPDGDVIVATQRHVVRISDGKAETMSLPDWMKNLRFTRVRGDRDGALWLAAADFGLVRLHKDRAESFTTADGLSGNEIRDLFEDREGNVWVSNSGGLDQFRPVAGALFAANKGLEGRARSILATHDGAIWAVTTKAVYRLDQPEVMEVRRGAPGSLFEDRQGRVWLYSLSEFGYFDGGRLTTVASVPTGAVDGMDDDSRGNLWIAHREAGLLLLRPDGSVEQTPWASVRPSFRVSTITVDPNDDSLWLGSWSGALMNLAAGRVRAFFELGESRDSPRVSQIRVETDGTVWVSNGNGLSRVKDGRVTLLDSDSGLPCDRVLETLSDPHWFWLRARCGVIRVARTAIDAWGGAADRAAELPKLDFQVLDQSDGVVPSETFSVSARLAAMRNTTPFMTQSQDGRLWIKTSEGIVMIDPARIPKNSIPPPVHVEQLVSDGKRFDSQVGLRLPPLQRDVAIDYTGLSFAAPEKVQFRYKLEGRDAAWQDAGQRRQAFYTDLSPGDYRFRVIAANPSGVWNHEGDTLEFSIAPAYYQTLWFYGLCTLASFVMLFALHRLRLRQVSGQIRGRLEARLAERERIARDLHDTLLQGIQGLILRFQAAADRIPHNVPARALMEKSLDRADKLLLESRDKVKDLRPSASDVKTLEEALAIEGAQFAEFQPAAFSIRVLGAVRELHPIVHEESLLIAREALGNAFQHARAVNIEAEVTYGVEALQICIRDDGQGIGSAVLASGRPGHFGLIGMRERANKLGAHLAVWSKQGAGTEVELGVPAAVAYPSVRQNSAGLRRWAELLRAKLLILRSHIH
ncbi:sensor histidine kinase [Variovorax saccharolyticus]|uniref:sensor histidine kinase n=1 Tax=Variovorax saccharolyticus TaxID=3053516 RepID=UPI002574BA13|nr:sensor histidine kinase [Variovorax sp. J22R187]MDM0022320.1 two-component regulator propeller domain-containing protein [Variovorax sp. J22R187]